MSAPLVLGISTRRFDSGTGRVIARYRDGELIHCQCETSQGGFGRACHCTHDGAPQDARKDSDMDDMFDPYLDRPAAAQKHTTRSDSGEETVQARLDAARKDPAFDPLLFWGEEYRRESLEREAARRAAAAPKPATRRDVDDEFFDPYLDSVGG